MAVMHENKKIAATDLDSIHRTLVHVAINDLFWEVKVKALDFWFSVIRSELTHQGVIDGDFPSVTFSKEKKKIVTLTEKEITSRLTRLLDELSTSGCLNVLLACMRDEDDLLVVKGSVRVIKFLTEFLDKYTYWQQLQEFHPNLQHANAIDSELVKLANARKTNIEQSALGLTLQEDRSAELARADEIIQTIVSAQDINLLSIACEHQMNMDTDADIDNPMVSGEIMPRTNVTAYQFLREVKSTDLDELIKSRTDWIAHSDSFSSLLNDMMYSLQVIPANEADCY